MQTSRLVMDVEAGPMSSDARGVQSLQGPQDEVTAHAI